MAQILDQPEQVVHAMQSWTSQVGRTTELCALNLAHGSYRWHLWVKEREEQSSHVMRGFRNELLNVKENCEDSAVMSAGGICWWTGKVVLGSSEF